jgi:hypothetical protein
MHEGADQWLKRAAQSGHSHRFFRLFNLAAWPAKSGKTIKSSHSSLEFFDIHADDPILRKP